MKKNLELTYCGVALIVKDVEHKDVPELLMVIAKSMYQEGFQGVEKRLRESGLAASWLSISDTPSQLVIVGHRFGGTA